MTRFWLVGGTPGSTAVLVAVDDDGVASLRWSGVWRAGLTAEGLATATGIPLVAQGSAGSYDRPGLLAHRPDGRGSAWSPALRVRSVEGDGQALRIEQADEVAGIRLATEIEAVAGGALRARHTLTGTGPLVVDELSVCWPGDDRAEEVLDLAGRHESERVPQRHRLPVGAWVRENRAGKTGLGSTTLVVVGPVGFGFGHGSVQAVHIAWSGNHVHRVERTPAGAVVLAGAELLLPGEVVLAAGEAYATPWVYPFAADDGLDGLAAQAHAGLRAGPAHPRGPRPVTFNVWEAVYFDHDLSRLRELAALAARVGVERFVLDDGWFGARRHDHAGLGDWSVSEQAWPMGLGPLAEVVTGLGMQLGLWFEPEMVNPDSDLFREHPDWVLATGGRLPPAQRNQLVLDLGRPAVRTYLLEAMSAVLSAYPISFVKWDHNRDLADAGSGLRDGGPGVHAQTGGAYDLWDQLRAGYPDVEWESCASGGGRIDLAILERAERVWTSDMTDALARQDIQRWTSQLVPLERLGAHVSATRAHQTGRVLPLALRAVTAMFGHFGIEWDLTAASPEELAELAGWVSIYREHRGLLHRGRLFRGDLPSDLADVVRVQGVVAVDGSAAVVSCCRLDLSLRHDIAVRVQGLLPETSFSVTALSPAASTDLGSLTGAELATVGLTLAMASPQDVRLLVLRPV